MQTQVKTPMEKVIVLTTIDIRTQYKGMAKMEKQYFFNYMNKKHGKTPTGWRNKLNGDAPMTMPERQTATEFFEAWNKNVVLQ